MLEPTVRQPAEPYFRCSLFPTFLEADGVRTGRFLLPTFWQIRSPVRAGVEGVPRRYDALLVFDGLFHSVLPYTFRQNHRIHTRPLSIPVAPWHGIPCTAGVADLWLLALDQQTTIHVILSVRLPERSADSDPAYPLIGFEFLRHYEPRLILDYATFPHTSIPDSTIPVGHLELV